MEEAEQTAHGYYMRADENGDGKLEWNGMYDLEYIISNPDSFKGRQRDVHIH